MQVTILIGAAAYAHIKTSQTSMDVRLQAGKSAEASLAETAEEFEQRAERYARQAALIREAAAYVALEKVRKLAA
jgi:hypothetical protein